MCIKIQIVIPVSNW